jgi:hypothetical protein
LGLHISQRKQARDLLARGKWHGLCVVHLLRDTSTLRTGSAG